MLRAIVFAATCTALIACAATDQEAAPNDAPANNVQLESVPEAETPESPTPPEVTERPSEPETSYTRIRFGLDSREDVPTAADRARCEAAGGKAAACRASRHL